MDDSDSNFSPNNFNNVNEFNLTELFNYSLNNLQPPICDMSFNESITPASHLYPQYIIPQYVPSQPTDNNSVTIINIIDVIVVSSQTNHFEVYRFVIIPVPPQFINNLEMQQQLNHFPQITDGSSIDYNLETHQFQQ